MSGLNTGYIAQLMGGCELWEPLWGLTTSLTEIESCLLKSSPVRRLQFIHHSGVSYINTHHVATRLQHTIGVFSLVAYYCPDWYELRVAALLHDIGHYPFSHVLEQIEGCDHHKRTYELLYSSEISGILIKYGFDPRIILDLIEGTVTSPLRNKDNKIHLDHLDSWVRSAQITGILNSSTKLLSRLELNGNYISTDTETAETLLQFIISEAKFHCSGENIGPSAILKYLVTQLIEQNVLSVESISEMTDASLESLLLRCEWTQEEAKRLFYSPHEIIVTRTQPKVSSNSHVVAFNKLYLSEPLITNERVPVNALPSYSILGELSSVLGTYYVYWDE
ncbi:HD domain-containing protein [Paenibacillus antarcticus]|uniref:HD/PDEase domain-containing protein n=1 Tax=Paenibacillus antarcticus TaxID=253703 RepID=A0A162MCN7_9BACL|nr:HD domain-containing protein [Paenibacillus antarcticus]OAB47195.1 hypothetical protein PBAT_07930 [Paenibacillus antarcticus]